MTCLRKTKTQQDHRLNEDIQKKLKTEPILKKIIDDDNDNELI